MSLLADIYLKTNDWANATHAADIVLERGKSHNKVTGHSIPRLFNPQTPDTYGVKKSGVEMSRL